MSKAIVINEFGGPGVLQWQDVTLPEPGPAEVRVRHHAVGLNFIDTYQRSGLYPLPLPSGLGLEAAGRITHVGAEVSDFVVGEAVAYTSMPPGAYAEERNYPAAKLVKLPDGIDMQTGAAVMLKGLTAWYLLKRSYAVQAGDTVLLYAAAGGVGVLAAQWAQHLGARVIGVVSTAAKAELALRRGCSEIIMADDANFVGRVRDLTGGAGVAAVYDSVGRSTFMQSLDCLRTHGTMVTFGNASGPVDAIAPLELSKRGSLFLTRPVLFDFIATPDTLRAAAAELFAVLKSGAVEIEIGQSWPLADVAAAHTALEARRTQGATLLLP